MRFAFVAAAVLLVPGCIYAEPGPREVVGTAKGYAPTPAFLKVEVATEDGKVVLVGFDRRDWHVAELARRIDDRRVREVALQGMERNTPGEVLAESFRDPDELNSLRYAMMGIDEEERLRLDREYDFILKRASEAAALVPTTPKLL